MIGAQANAPRYGDLAQAGQPQRMSEVQEQVSRSSAVTERLQDKFKTLYDRLQPVLRQSPPEATQKGEGRPTLVGHAMALSNHNDQLELLDGMMGDILSRIEL